MSQSAAGSIASSPGLRLVVIGHGVTRGRRAHLLRLRESLMRDLKIVADGQVYLLIEIALQRLIDDLKARPSGIEVVQVSELEPTSDDDMLLDQRRAKNARAARAVKVGAREPTPMNDAPPPKKKAKGRARDPLPVR